MLQYGSGSNPNLTHDQPYPCPNRLKALPSSHPLFFLDAQVALLLKEMLQGKSENIGLSWAPKIPPFSSGTNENLDKGKAPQLNIDSKNNIELIDGLFVPPNDPRKLNKLLRKQVKDSAGKSWFDMPAPTITPEIKKDLEILKLRNVIDPKRHYKKSDSKTLPKYFQVGTVIESPTDFFSGRITKKERKPTIADELLSDPSLVQYRKRKVHEIEDQNRSVGVTKWKIKGRQTRKRAKERRV